MVEILPPSLGADVDLEFPALYRGRRAYSADEAPVLPVEQIPAAVKHALQPLLAQVRPGQRVAITAGSRGIANIPLIIRSAGEALKALGAEPFVMPAMGSHGGATADGQREMVTGYGITTEATGLPIVSSMDVQVLGTLDNGMPVYWSTTALEADHVLVINRVKPHTDFRGPFESGIAKMCAIGLGKQRGAQTIHSYGTRGLAELMPAAARFIVEHTGDRILGGLAILENAYDQTACIEAVLRGGIAKDQEGSLLKKARGLMAALPFDRLDVLVVDEMGKNVSGTGMDTNVLGRMFVPGVPEDERPRITAVVVLGLTPESHGNAIGIGLADFTTQHVLADVDWQATYVNGYASGLGGLLRNRVPNVLADDRAAIATAIRMCGQPDLSQLKLARIRNTLTVADVDFSPALLNEALAGRVAVTGEPCPMRFDAAARLLPTR